MTRFTGKQYPGALKDLREQKRREAEQRTANHQALNSPDTQGGMLPHERDGWVQIDDLAHEPVTRSAATRLLNAIFGISTERQVQP